MTTHRWALVALVGLLSSGCGKDNDLSGSIGELFSLTFSRVEVYRNSEALQVSYYNNRGSDIDLVVRFTVGVSDLTLTNGMKIDLASEYLPGHQRTSVIHLASGEPVRVFPAVAKGDFVLNSGAIGTETLRGNFSMSFDRTADYGGGRTLVGNFTSATARDAAFDPCPEPPCPPMP